MRLLSYAIFPYLVVFVIAGVDIDRPGTQWHGVGQLVDDDGNGGWFTVPAARLRVDAELYDGTAWRIWFSRVSYAWKPELT